MFCLGIPYHALLVYRSVWVGIRHTLEQNGFALSGCCCLSLLDSERMHLHAEGVSPFWNSFCQNLSLTFSGICKLYSEFFRPPPLHIANDPHTKVLDQMRLIDTF